MSNSTPHYTYQQPTNATGPVADRDKVCVICCIEIRPQEASIIHIAGQCRNSFHQFCFEALFSDSINRETNLSCPICRVMIDPIPVFGPEISPAMAQQRERTRAQRLEVIEILFEKQVEMELDLIDADDNLTDEERDQLINQVNLFGRTFRPAATPEQERARAELQQRLEGEFQDEMDAEVSTVVSEAMANDERAQLTRQISLVRTSIIMAEQRGNPHLEEIWEAFRDNDLLSEAGFQQTMVGVRGLASHRTRRAQNSARRAYQTAMLMGLRETQEVYENRLALVEEALATGNFVGLYR